LKKLDPTTLEAIAEIVCGAGQGAGGGASYSAPGVYRSMSDIQRFFDNTGVAPASDHSTRKWFVLESLEHFNEEKAGSVIPVSLEKVILRLANPLEYRNDPDVTKKVIEHLNTFLQVEGLKVVLEGVQPRLHEIEATISSSRLASNNRKPTPCFDNLTSSSELVAVLSSRWEEALICFDARAYLSAIVILGSILEGALLSKIRSCPEAANKSKSSPKDKTSGKLKHFSQWTLCDLITVSHDVGWIQASIRDFSDILRNYRNLIHPFEQLKLGIFPDQGTCSICIEVVRAAIDDLVRSEGDQ